MKEHILRVMFGANVVGIIYLAASCLNICLKILRNILDEIKKDAEYDIILRRLCFIVIVGFFFIITYVFGYFSECMYLEVAG